MLAQIRGQGPAADRGRQGRSRGPSRHRRCGRGAGGAVHRVLRRPDLRRGRARLQGAQGDARRHDRGGVGEHPDLRDVEPPASAARVFQREPGDAAHRRGSASRRIGRGEDLALRAFRPVDLVLPVQPGRLPGRGRVVAGGVRRRAREIRARIRGDESARRCSSRCSADRAAVASPGSSRGGTRARRRCAGNRASDRRRRIHRPRRRGGDRAPGRARTARAASDRQGLRGLLGIPGRQARAGRDPAARARSRAQGRTGPRGAPCRALDRAAIPVSARARRAALLSRLRMGRRAGRPRRSGVRVAKAGEVRRRAAAAREHARAARAAAPRGLRHHDGGRAWRRGISRARARPRSTAVSG